MRIEQVRPEDIERRSFEIITELLGERQPSEETAHIVKRVIHTTADLEYAESLYFSENAAQEVYKRQGSHSGKRARVEQLGFSAQDIADGGACNLDKAFERPVLYLSLIHI